MNVGVHTLTKGYFLKYSGVDFSGALAALTLALEPPLFLPPIEWNESNECNGLLDIVYYNIIVYVVYTSFIRRLYAVYTRRILRTPVFDFIEEFHDTLPIRC